MARPYSEHIWPCCFHNPSCFRQVELVVLLNRNDQHNNCGAAWSRVLDDTVEDGPIVVPLLCRGEQGARTTRTRARQHTTHNLWRGVAVKERPSEQQGNRRLWHCLCLGGQGQGWGSQIATDCRLALAVNSDGQGVAINHTGCQGHHGLACCHRSSAPPRACGKQRGERADEKPEGAQRRTLGEPRTEQKASRTSIRSLKPHPARGSGGSPLWQRRPCGEFRACMRLCTSVAARPSVEPPRHEGRRGKHNSSGAQKMRNEPRWTLGTIPILSTCPETGSTPWSWCDHGCRGQPTELPRLLLGKPKHVWGLLGANEGTNPAHSEESLASCCVITTRVRGEERGRNQAWKRRPFSG